ncbi:ABC transporter ATP-binding protein [Stackebrandtia nassauensis]|uniref:ABC transporter related protein n=1 Tax=Stackebrandtia nassauensis (strain DSM 44728 / CIP 108903 / NRRL B-16338 / NBRC 102104 / LLR-40K-21) TaxID=446470 RepID=D3Q433_STANL|nr:ABC transporter ATP-binding protein [Stackebrandtia nassauensis]ADD45918.1 ABC transporter related protein [Stackebrandtia nassauensis DSM 44728]
MDTQHDRVTAREPGSRAVTAVHAVRTLGLTKRYGRDATAVDSLELTVPYGSVYGFLGPNGSGKTTTIRMLLGLIEATDGHCELLGRAMPAAATRVLPHVGVMVDGPSFHPTLSGRDNLLRLDAADRTADRATVRARTTAALDRVGLTKAARKPFRTYSLGMKQRLAIAAALLRPRRLLILDEPTNGLDPQGTREVRSLIADLARDGLTVLLSTHLLSEVEQMCDHVGIMHRGRLKIQGTLDDVRSSVPTRIRVDTRTPDAVTYRLRDFGLNPTRTATHVTADLGDAEPEKILSTIVGDGIPVREFRVLEPTLEEVFISLTGEGFDADT